MTAASRAGAPVSDPARGHPHIDSRRVGDRRSSSGNSRVGILMGFFVVAMLSGCQVGPQYERPAALGTKSVPAHFDGTATNAEWKAAEPRAHLTREAWWSVFSAPELDRLMALANGGNQDLAAAFARFDQAHSLVTVARSGLFPTLDATPSYQRVRTSANAVQLGRPAGQGYNYNNFSAPLTAGWEADLWGRVRHQVEGAQARLSAAADDVESLKLEIQAEVATDYFTLLALDAELDLLRQTVEAYRKSLELTQNRRQGGIATDLDVAQAETLLKSTEAQLPVVELQRRKVSDALATLCGEPATGFSPEAPKVMPERPPGLPQTLPSELLERRPDIAAAERRMAAANADVGVAQAAFYPRVQLQGLAGFQSINAGTVFNWPSRFWSVGPSLDLPIFTGGRNQAQLAAARAAYTETTAIYRQTVLTAFQEVEDQLAAGRLLAAQLEGETAALTAARRTLEIANNRYQSGLVTYLEVATAASEALTHERTVVRLKAEQFNASIALIKALGGGW